MTSAIGSYDVVIALEPDNRFGYFGRGRARAATRDYAAGDRRFRQGHSTLPPILPRHILRRGLAKVTSGDVDGALADCDRAATLDPKARDAHYCEGMAWHAKGDAGRAIAASYAVAIGIDPERRCHLLRARHGSRRQQGLYRRHRRLRRGAQARSRQW
ncbi:tetratricopeptide repeat protein [Mesorhizobium atlanticum]